MEGEGCVENLGGDEEGGGEEDEGGGELHSDPGEAAREVEDGAGEGGFAHGVEGGEKLDYSGDGEPFPVGKEEVVVLPCDREETWDLGDEGAHC